jgi:hypothetical protein
MTDNSKMFDSLQERNEQVLNNISQLQLQEKDLHNSLDDVSLTSEQKRVIMDRINQISQIRMNLYAGLKDMVSNYKQDVDASTTTLGQSIVAVNILEDELINAKKRMGLIDDQTNNKQRLVEINTYYGKRYNAHTNLMKTIVFICIPIMILAILANKGILPTKIYLILSGIILVIGCLLLLLQLIDISNRDNMNWDEYDWYFDKSSAPEPSKSTSTETNPWKTPSFTCVGTECCYEGSTYDYDKNICVPNDIYTENTNETTETFKVLEKYAYNSQFKMTPFYNNVAPLVTSLSKF